MAALKHKHRLHAVLEAAGGRSNSVRSIGARIKRAEEGAFFCRVAFTPAMWNRWLKELNDEPPHKLVAGIAEFRSLLDKG